MVYLTEILSNKATEGAGLSLEEIKKVRLRDLEFDGNIAEGNGGAVRAEKVQSFEVIDTQLSRGKALKGGAFFMIDINNTVVFDLTVLNDNSVEQDGGGFFLEDANSVTFKDCNISGSKALENGGGIMLKSVASLNASSVLFKENWANVGGALAIIGSGDFQMTAGRFEGNRAESFKGSNIEVSSCEASVRISSSDIEVPILTEVKKHIGDVEEKQYLQKAMHAKPECPQKVIQMIDCEYTYHLVGPNRELTLMHAN